MAGYGRDTGAARARLLVVEDDKTIREYCRLLLRLHYDVDTAENGRVAVEILRQQRYDLVLTDLQMPDMDGIALLQHIRAHHPDIDTVILTAFATVDTAKQALRLGALDYLAKPIEADNLERLVRTCLEIRRIRQEKERLSDLVVMYQFSQLIASTLDTETQVLKITDFLWQRFNPESLAISLLYPDEEEPVLALLIFKTRQGGAVQTNHVPLPAMCGDEELVAGHLRLIGGMPDDDPDLLAGAVLRTHAHAIGYVHLTRGTDQPPFDASDHKLLGVFASQIAASLDNARLYEQLKLQNWQTIEALAEAIDARDAYTYGHSRQVTRYAVRLAEVVGLPRERIELLRYAALLHDVGKIGIRDYVLLKPGALTAEEFDAMKRHPEIGAKILRKVHGLRAAIPIVESHHEQVDGGGYPYGLRGDQMPVEARILAIADSFEAMTAERAYRSAMETEQALQILINGGGAKWDADLVAAFVALIRSEGEALKIGGRVRQARDVPLYPVMEAVPVPVDLRD